MPKRPNNYRPISALPVLNKVFEKATCIQVYHYFEYFNFFTNAHFGFRGVSTAHAIINKQQFEYDNLDIGDSALSMFSHFRNAFNCMNHKIVQSKLNMYGICNVALDWFRSYPSGRYHCVAMNDFLSEPRVVSFGVS